MAVTKKVKLSYFEIRSRMYDGEKDIVRNHLRNIPNIEFEPDVNPGVRSLSIHGDIKELGDNIFMGTVVNGQLDDIPVKYNASTNVTEGLNLNEHDQSEGLGVDTQFIIDAEINLLMIETFTGSVTAKTFIDYLGQHFNYSLTPIVLLDQKELEDVLNLRKISKFTLKVGRTTNSSLSNEDIEGLNNVLDLEELTNFDALTLELKARAGTRNRGLIVDTIINWVRKLVSYREQEVEKLIIEGFRQDGSPLEVLDLIKQKLEDYYTYVKPEERITTSFHITPKHIELKSIYFAKKEELRRIYAF